MLNTVKHEFAWYLSPFGVFTHFQYSQVGQDLFVVRHLKEKRHGTFLEIGSNHPLQHSNTALLERRYGWQGLAIEIEPKFAKRYLKKRKSPCINADALDVEFAQILPDFFSERHINYLSIDCEPAETTFMVLDKIIQTGFTFDLITFEHDLYRDGPYFKDKAFNLLSMLGYSRIHEDVCFENRGPFEDWYAKELQSH
jgi:hypothetical protein